MPNKPFLDVLAGRIVKPTPIWVMRQAGRYLPEYRKIRAGVNGFLDLCYTPELAAEVTLQPIRRFALDAAILFSDILVVPHALGQPVTFVEGRGPVLEPLLPDGPFPPADPARFDEIVAKICATVRLVRVDLPDQTALIGFAGAPWTVITYMVEGGSSRDFAATKTWAYRHPDRFAELFDLVETATITYLRAQIDAGAETVKLFDSWSGVLSEQQFARWVIAPTRRIRDALRDSHPGVPVIGFPRGAGVRVVEYAAKTGIDMLALDQGVPVLWAAENLPPDLPVQGNLDQIALLAGGDAMRSEVEAILSGFKNRPHVFNLGHGILPSTPVEHMIELIDLVHGN